MLTAQLSTPAIPGLGRLWSVGWEQSAVYLFVLWYPQYHQSSDHCQDDDEDAAGGDHCGASSQDGAFEVYPVRRATQALLPLSFPCP